MLNTSATCAAWIGKGSWENEDLKSIRAAIKMTKPDDFEYIVEKTICLMRGISLKTFQAYKDDVKEKLRKKVDPDESLRKMNKETLQQVEKHRAGTSLAVLREVDRRDRWGESDLWSRPAPGVQGWRDESDRWSGRPCIRIQ